MATPYVTPSMISNAPTGIAWDIIPFPQATNEQQLAEQYNMCWRATGMVDAYCNQILRATVDTEPLSGPDYRITIEQHTGNARIILSRWPVTEVLQVAVAGNTFPRQWVTVPAGYYEPEFPIIGVYGTSAPSAAGDGGQTMYLGGGYLNWHLGRRGYRVSATYLNGWPHTSLLADANVGDRMISVDDVTGFGITDVTGWTGASAFVYDGGNTETITATATSAEVPLVLPFGGTVQSGPGSVNLASPLAFAHAAGTVVSAMPQNILWATILATTVQALEAGITAVTIQNIPGSATVGGQGISGLDLEYKAQLRNYRRTV